MPSNISSQHIKNLAKTIKQNMATGRYLSTNANTGENASINLLRHQCTYEHTKYAEWPKCLTILPHHSTPLFKGETLVIENEPGIKMTSMTSRVHWDQDLPHMNAQNMLNGQTTPPFRPTIQQFSPTIQPFNPTIQPHCSKKLASPYSIITYMKMFSSMSRGKCTL